MSALVTHWEDLGDGNVRVRGRTSAGHDIDLTTGRHMLGTPLLQVVADRWADTVDSRWRAVGARAGRTESEE